MKKFVIITTEARREEIADRGDGSVAVVCPMDFCPAVDVDGIMVDVELKHEWDFDVDQWFHEHALPQFASNGAPVYWVKDQQDANSS